MSATCPGRHQIRQTSTTFVINDKLRLAKDYLSGLKRAEENTYPRSDQSDQFIRLKVIKPLGYVQQLERR